MTISWAIAFTESCITILMLFTWSNSILLKRKLCLWSIITSHDSQQQKQDNRGKKTENSGNSEKRILKEMERSKNSRLLTSLPISLSYTASNLSEKRSPISLWSGWWHWLSLGFQFRKCVNGSHSPTCTTHFSLFFFFCAEAFPRNKLGQLVLSLLETQLGQWEEEQVEISEQDRWPGKSWLLANPLD